MAHTPIQQAIRELLAKGVAFSSGDLAAKTGLSRQALQIHLARAIEAGELLRFMSTMLGPRGGLLIGIDL